MKKLTFLAAAAFIAASMTSCKKNYTCECSYTAFGATQTYSATANLKKKDAEAWCTSQAGSGTGYTYSCKLK